jgi:DNA-directed RNA polymerase specialized sigma24 family protein
MEASRTEHACDLQLAQDVSAGVLAAWHEFVERYSALVLSVVRRYLADFDSEVTRDAYVDVLESMYSNGLARYDGRAALSTWVMAIARSRALDRRRALRGRHREPAWLARLPDRDREIFRLHYEDGESLEAIRDRFASRGEPLTAAEIVRALDRLEARVDRRLRTRLAYDLHARTVGAASGSLLDFLDHLRRENRAASEALRPDLLLMERRTRRLLDRVRRSVQDLDAEERKVVELRFYRALTAQQIADELGLAGPRRAYTLINRAVVNLRHIAFGEAQALGRAGAEASALGSDRRDP